MNVTEENRMEEREDVINASQNNNVGSEGASELKKKARWWNVASVVAAIVSVCATIVSVCATIWIGYSANEIAKDGVKIADKALQASRESNEIASIALLVSGEANLIAETGTDIAREANDIALQVAIISEASNMLSFAANALADKSNRLSDQANKISKDSLTTANSALAVTEEMKKLAEKGNEITDRFNNIQYNIQRSNLLKESSELFNSDKMNCCKNIIYTYYRYFYVMADLPIEKMNNLLTIPISPYNYQAPSRLKMTTTIYKNKLLAQNEWIVENEFSREVANYNPSKYDISCVLDAIEFYMKTVMNHNDIVALYEMNDKIDDYSFGRDISDLDYFLCRHLDESIILMLTDLIQVKKLSPRARGYWEKSFNVILKNKKAFRAELLKNRDLIKEMYRNNIAHTKKKWFSKNQELDFWKAMIAFSEKNDKRFSGKKKK